MTSSIALLLAEASASVPRIDPAAAREMIADGALLLDVRDAPESAIAGSIPGSVHVSRGMLEFRADPGSAYFDSRFDRARPVILYCASGGRSALAGRTLQSLGYTRVYNLGGFKDWVAAGGAADTAPQAMA